MPSRLRVGFGIGVLAISLACSPLAPEIPAETPEAEQTGATEATRESEKTGTSLSFQLLSDSGSPSEQEAERTVAVLRDRLRAIGPDDVVVKRGEGDKIGVELRHRRREDLERVSALMQARGRLRIRLRAPVAMEADERGKRTMAEFRRSEYEAPIGTRWVPMADVGNPVLVLTPEAVVQARVDRLVEDGGSPSDLTSLRQELALVRSRSLFEHGDLESARLAEIQGRYVVRVVMRESRKRAFEGFTGSNVGRQLVIIVNEHVEATPSLLTKLPGAFRLVGGGAGGFREEKARHLAAGLASGDPPCRVRRTDVDEE